LAFFLNFVHLDNEQIHNRWTCIFVNLWLLLLNFYYHIKWNPSVKKIIIFICNGKIISLHYFSYNYQDGWIIGKKPRNKVSSVNVADDEVNNVDELRTKWVKYTLYVAELWHILYDDTFAKYSLFKCTVYFTEIVSELLRNKQIYQFTCVAEIFSWNLFLFIWTNNVKWSVSVNGENISVFSGKLVNIHILQG